MMSRAQIIKWHRKLGWLAGIAILIWGMSGLLHPLMTWTNPRPASFDAPASHEFMLPSLERLQSVLQRHDVSALSSLHVLAGDGRPLMRITSPVRNPETFYIDLKSGKIIDDADRERAISLARHYTGDHDAPVRESTLISSFSNRYPYINRYLPAWKVTFERPDGLTAYVETDTGRLGSITNTRKIVLQTLFQTIHMGQFMDGLEIMRLVMIGGLVILILPMAVLGLLMLRGKGRRKGTRLWHRVVGFVVWIPLFMFPASGLSHLVLKSPLVYKEDVTPVLTAAATDLRFMPQGRVTDLRLIISDKGESWWRAEIAEGGAVYMRATDGEVAADDDMFLRSYAGLAGDAPMEEITRFTNEYGFAYKRLPVWRIADDEEVLFMEARTGVTAARIRPLDMAESWSFSNLHKWQFLDPLSRKIMGHGPFGHAMRDVIMIFFVGLALCAAATGMILLVRGRKK